MQEILKQKIEDIAQNVATKEKKQNSGIIGVHHPVMSAQ